MSTNLRKLSISVALLLLIFLAGYAVGHHRTFRWLMGVLSVETQGNLTYRVETLARLRTGDAEGAIELLEKSVDRATVTLPQGQPWSALSEGVQRALMTAKVYREAYPPEAGTGELSEVLSMVPLPDVRYCSPALRQLLEQSRASADVPK